MKMSRPLGAALGGAVVCINFCRRRRLMPRNKLQISHSHQRPLSTSHCAAFLASADGV